jgi:ParB family transcriptional regulator, chromosome partitioning protein
VELEPRTAAPAHATGAVVFLPLAALDEDVTFRLREEGDVAALASSIGRLGQLAPIEVRPFPAPPGAADRYQIVGGFRRVAALRLLVRERVLARVHARLDDEDAWSLALAEPLLAEPLLSSELEALRRMLAGAAPVRWAEELVDAALVRAPVDPLQRERFLEFLREGEARRAVAVDEPLEMTPEELAEDLGRRMWEVNQDLSVAAESWAELPADGRRTILEQARWVAALLAHLETR